MIISFVSARIGDAVALKYDLHNLFFLSVFLVIGEKSAVNVPVATASLYPIKIALSRRSCVPWALFVLSSDRPDRRAAVCGYPDTGCVLFKKILTADKLFAIMIIISSGCFDHMISMHRAYL
jgi:hypothetical protein